MYKRNEYALNWWRENYARVSYGMHYNNLLAKNRLTKPPHR